MERSRPDCSATLSVSQPVHFNFLDKLFAMKIAIAQTVLSNDPQENLRKAEVLAKKASSKHADIIVFPEYFTDPDWSSTNSNQVFFDFYKKMAQKYNINIIPGSFAAEEDGKLFNTTYFINEAGEIVADYQKINTWLSERQLISRGDKISVFDTPFGKIGLTICWDLAFPEIFRELIKEGVKIVFCPSMWSTGDAGKGIKYNKNAEKVFANSLCTARAFENGIILVFCNYSGVYKYKNKVFESIGQSQVTAPFIGPIIKAKEKEELLIADVDLKILNDAEDSYEIHKDLKISE